MIVPTSENFMHTWGLHSCSSEETSVFLVSWNEMWGWYTILDENPDRDRDSASNQRHSPLLDSQAVVSCGLKYSTACFIFRRLSSGCQVPVFSPENQESTVTLAALWLCVVIEMCFKLNCKWTMGVTFSVILSIYQQESEVNIFVKRTEKLHIKP